jgi:hypothetical protein
MAECVKCGRANAQDAPACVDCQWPFILSAWQKSTHHIRRITIDTGCVNARQQNEDLNQLERWAQEGQLLIERSPAFLQELVGPARVRKAQELQPHPAVWVLDQSSLGVDTTLAGPDVHEEVRDVLFPTTSSLTSNQAADVEHLRSHVLTGADAFVTLNPRDFILRGKQESLQQLGIWAFTPKELVALLRALYGWP